MATYSTAPVAQPVGKTSGITRLQEELTEAVKRIYEVTNSINAAADYLYGARPQEAGENAPSANTVDSRLGDIRRALTHLEETAARLHNS